MLLVYSLRIHQNQTDTATFSTPVNFGQLKNVEIAMEGNLELPQNIPYVQSVVNASGGSVRWFTASGTNVTVSGSQDPDWGWIDGAGNRCRLSCTVIYLILSFQRLGNHGG